MIYIGLRRSREFDGCSIRWLYAIGAKQSEDDEPIHNPSREPTAALYQDGTSNKLLVKA